MVWQQLVNKLQGFVIGILLQTSMGTVMGILINLHAQVRHVAVRDSEHDMHSSMDGSGYSRHHCSQAYSTKHSNIRIR